MRGNVVKKSLVVFACGAGAVLCSCSTLNSAGNVSQDSPRYFTGTQLNIAAISQDHEKLAYFRQFSMTPAEMPAVDLPLSAALDTVLFPFVLTCSMTQYIFSDMNCLSGL